jgi:hypothetical protein
VWGIVLRIDASVFGFGARAEDILVHGKEACIELRVSFTQGIDIIFSD